MTAEEYKALSLREFDRAAAGYESGRAGVYELCKKDYPPILAELEKEPFRDLLDCGCGTGPILSLLSERYPDRRFTGIDFSEKMLEKARAKRLPNVTLVLGDCEALPFAGGSFDVVICSQSFHHYPNPQAFFAGVARVLRPGGRLILRDNTGSLPYLLYQNWWMIPYINWKHHSGDVKFYSRREVRHFLKKAGFSVICLEERPVHKLHAAARKPLKAR